ncbi:unnamed protein product [Rangifer tarandus platyrhynchus]|uniref:Basic proline-rich protein-like n=1 Tax=Rangifer tarandus platyrhynchus TaxID=3082113 RepID=A0ABN8XTB3_RANTA|nr:unnamed protein product [Rangifer tarandus platyrhynchus]
MASLARPSSTAGHCLHISRGSSGVHSSGFHCPCQEPEPQEKTALPPLRTHLLCCCSAGTREPTPAAGAVSPPPGPHEDHPAHPTRQGCPHAGVTLGMGCPVGFTAPTSPQTPPRPPGVRPNGSLKASAGHSTDAEHSTNWPVPLPEVHARTERPESGWEAVSAASARDRETRTTLGECSRRPWPSAGAGALSSLRARREGRPAQPRAPKAAFPPRGRAGPFAPAHSPFAPPLRRLEQAAPRDRCPYPKWRPRPGLTGSPLQPAPEPPLARSTALPALTAGPRGAALRGRRTRLAGATARVDRHHPPGLPTFSQPSGSQRLAPGASSDSPAPGIGSFGSQWRPGGGRGRSIPVVRRALGLASWRPRADGRDQAGLFPRPPSGPMGGPPGARGGRAGGGAEP